MRDHIEKRAITVAEYIVRTKATVRDAAAYFGVSKSTVHKDVAERLKYIDPGLYAETAEVLRVNLAERHLRGGIATKEKYLARKH